MGTVLDLVVLRAADLEQSRRFYEALGLRFACERHGNGPEHLAARSGGLVFELYPQGSGPATAGMRLGFRVTSVEAAVSAVQQLGAKVAMPAAEGPWGLRAVVIDPDGHQVEVRQAND